MPASLPANATWVQAWLRVSHLVIPPLQTTILLMLYPKPKFGYTHTNEWARMMLGEDRMQFVIDFQSPVLAVIHRRVCSGCIHCWNVLNIRRLR